MGGADGDEDCARARQDVLDLPGPVGVPLDQQGAVQARALILHVLDDQPVQRRHVAGHPGVDQSLELVRPMLHLVQGLLQRGDLLAERRLVEQGDLFGRGLEGAARSAWEDMCLLTRRLDEAAYRLVGAAVAFPTDWRIADKLGRPLIALHAPIHGYAEQLGSPVDQFMAKLKPGRIYGRCNWFVSPTDALRWMAGPPERDFAHVTAENAGETLYVRSERQTLRKLPETGAIVFAIGIYRAPLGSLSAGNVARMAEALATIPEPEARRRGAPHFAPQLQAYARRHGAAIGQAA